MEIVGCPRQKAADYLMRASPLQVTVTNPGGGSSGGLTDVELRATPVPVSGTVTANVGTVPVTGSFYQATQPVSIAASVAVTGAFYPATQPVSGTVAVSGSVAVTGAFYQATQPVSIASMPSTPVTGTFWQATQPVSGTVAANINGTVPVSIASMPSTPVTGTFFQATQPVSIAATVATRNLKDAGRTQFSAATVIGGVACVTSEALLSMVSVRAGVAAAGATTIAVTAGKTLRLTAIVFSAKSTGAAVLAGICALRMNPNGAVAANSPILAILSTTQQAAALAQAGDTCVLPLPDGIEISGTQQVGLSQVCSATTGVVYASLVGFEY